MCVCVCVCVCVCAIFVSFTLKTEDWVYFSFSFFPFLFKNWKTEWKRQLRLITSSFDSDTWLYYTLSYYNPGSMVTIERELNHKTQVHFLGSERFKLLSAWLCMHSSRQRSVVWVCIGRRIRTQSSLLCNLIKHIHTYTYIYISK